ncbi:glycoside hydrolase family 16 protein [Trichocladium antarcticum]|uniref:Glycoside hydrolase family 16 protein n=1 Tax=Trichocladium antarcticum TaxID=1450529 RepID=A0AAN6UKE1_9PEZI|nr:glycoside hydrolase family 16 protein [Trichocladium antarcticum]
MHFSYASVLPFLAASVAAWTAPSHGGYRLIWSDSFAGATNKLPNENNWNILDGNLGVNNELQTYKRSARQVQTSGGGTLQLVPWKDGAAWTSGRIESKYTFTPQAGRRTMAEASIRFGSNKISTKQGIWPAFWLLGNSIRAGTPWPRCGELDIMETVNGQLTGHATAHCDVYPGGLCNEPSGRSAAVAIPSQEWFRWRIVWDRTAADWRSQTITWFLNDGQFHRLRGDQINNADVWASLTARPLFFILNVAVGGNWPGNPNGNTLGGYGAMMEVGYVAQYSS